ncbi:cysteine peptidase family C39 domain-containing protein [Kitasatospora sp. NPDC048194]|uniref:cysteine peptidase family C39 domain-containing protein n=1 Tax=Kitasatospora sp. NPDC048194 TaxID=3364045 RepID=UPI003718083D
MVRRLSLRATSARVPFLPQLGLYDCGRACLAMVLGAHGAWDAVADLAAELPAVRPAGLRASALVATARRHGLAAQGVRVTGADGLRRLPTPFVLHQLRDHYVVVAGIRRGTAEVLDPDAGRERIPLDRLAELSSGVALVFAAPQRRSRAPRPVGSPDAGARWVRTRAAGRTAVARVARSVARSARSARSAARVARPAGSPTAARRTLLVPGTRTRALAATALAASSAVAAVVAADRSVATATSPGATAALVVLVLAVPLALGAATGGLTAAAGERTLEAFRAAFGRRLAAPERAYLDSRGTEDLVNRWRSAPGLLDALVRDPHPVGPPAVPVCALGALAAVDPVQAPIALASAVLGFALPAALAGRSSRREPSDARTAEDLRHLIDATESLRAVSAQRWAVTAWQQASGPALAEARRQERARQWSRSGLTAARALAALAPVLAAVVRHAPRAEGGPLLADLVGTALVTATATEAARRWRERRRAQVMLARLADAASAARDSPPAAPDAAVDAAVEVRFPEQAVVVPAGGLAWLVGEDPAAGTRLLRHLTALGSARLPPCLLDGRSPGAFLDARPGSVALVPRRPALIAGTVGDNVALGDPACTRERVAEALRTCGATGPEYGLDTPVEPASSRVDPARIGLARVLCRRAGLVLVDDLLGRLDPDEAAAVLSALRAGGATVLLAVTGPPPPGRTRPDDLRVGVAPDGSVLPLPAADHERPGDRAAATATPTRGDRKDRVGTGD